MPYNAGYTISALYAEAEGVTCQVSFSYIPPFSEYSVFSYFKDLEKRMKQKKLEIGESKVADNFSCN